MSTHGRIESMQLWIFPFLAAKTSDEGGKDHGEMCSVLFMARKYNRLGDELDADRKETIKWVEIKRSQLVVRRPVWYTVYQEMATR